MRCSLYFKIPHGTAYYIISNVHGKAYYFISNELESEFCVRISGAEAFKFELIEWGSRICIVVVRLVFFYGLKSIDSK